MTTPHPANNPAGWYPDPTGTGDNRWWNGVEWTNNLQTPYVRPLVGEPVPRAAAGTPTYNVFIGAIVGLLALLFMTQLLVAVEQTLGFSLTSGALGARERGDSVYNVGSLLSIVIYLSSVLLAFFDWRHIKSTGVQKPFHWAWSILSILVYLIGRGIVMRDRVGTGIATMWIAIVYIACIVVSSLVMFGLVATIYSNSPDFVP